MDFRCPKMPNTISVNPNMANDTRNSAEIINEFLFIVGLTGFRIPNATHTYTHSKHRIYSFILCMASFSLILFCVANIRTVQMDLFSDSARVIGTTQSIRDGVLLCGYLGLIFIGQIGIRAQQNFVDKLHAFDVRLRLAFEAEAIGRHRVRSTDADSAAKRSFWWECIVWMMYYNLLVYPIELYLWDFWSFAASVSFYGFVLSTLGFGWVQSWVKFCATLLQRRTQSVGELLRWHLIHGEQEDATIEGARPDMSVVYAIYSLTLVGDLCGLLRNFEAAFARTLMFVYEILFFSSLFNVYFTLQIIQRHNIADIVLIDFALYQVPQIWVCGWMVFRYMQHFGDEVSD